MHSQNSENPPLPRSPAFRGEGEFPQYNRNPVTEFSTKEKTPLVQSGRAHDGVCFDRIEPVHQRYVVEKTGSAIEMWTLSHQLQKIDRGKTRSLILDQPFTAVWSAADWNTSQETEAQDTGTGCWIVNLRAQELESATAVVFTFRFPTRWHGRNHHVRICSK